MESKQILSQAMESYRTFYCPTVLTGIFIVNKVTFCRSKKNLRYVTLNLIVNMSNQNKQVADNTIENKYCKIQAYVFEQILVNRLLNLDLKRGDIIFGGGDFSIRKQSRNDYTRLILILSTFNLISRNLEDILDDDDELLSNNCEVELFSSDNQQYEKIIAEDLDF